MKKVIVFLLLFALSMMACNKKEKDTSVSPAPSSSQGASNVEEQKPPGWTSDIIDYGSFKKDPPWVIGVANYSLGNSWRIQMMAELEYAANNDSRVTLVETNADGSISKLISDVNDLIARGVDALLVTPITPKGIASTVADAYDDGIPVVIFDGLVDTDKFHSTVWVDQYKFGHIGGTWLKEQLNGVGKIVVLDGIDGNSTSEARAQGALAALGPEIEVLARQPGMWAYDQGKSIMEDFIAAFPEIDGVYSQGGAMSQGVIEALKTAGRPLIPVTGEGYNGFLKEWVRNKANGFSSVGPDDPTWKSTAALAQAIKILKGEKVEKWHEVDISIITDDTVGDYALMDLPDGAWANTKMTKVEMEDLYKK